jgi:hypothetical protein
MKHYSKVCLITFLSISKIVLKDVIPEPIDLEKPQSFENNFIHHMAIGESSIMNKLRLNLTAMSIEKLIDDILRVKLAWSDNYI